MAKGWPFPPFPIKLGWIMRSIFKTATILFLSALATPLSVVLVKNLYLMEEASPAHQEKQLGVVAPFIFVMPCTGTVVVLALTFVVRFIWPPDWRPPDYPELYLAVAAVSLGFLGLPMSFREGARLVDAPIVFLFSAGLGLVWAMPVAAGLRWARHRGRISGGTARSVSRNGGHRDEGDQSQWDARRPGGSVP